jgi:ComEC/Rec2-related protein
MMIFLIPILLLSLKFKLYLLTHVADLTNYLHLFCLQAIPATNTQEINSALLCAENIKTLTLKQILIRSSLYHLIVVSGAHLVLLSTLFEKIFFFVKHRRLLQVMMLLTFILYSFMCRLEPPIVRATVAMFISLISEKQKLAYRPFQILLISTIICLSLEPSWWKSFSLLLSALSSLALLISDTKYPPGYRELAVYLVLLPALVGWSNVHPSGILTNIFLAPFISFVWLPSFLLCLIFPLFLPIYEKVVFAFLKYLSVLGEVVPAVNQSQPLPLVILWIFLASVFVFLSVRTRLQRRSVR